MITESEADKAMVRGLVVIVNGIDGEIAGRLVERKRFKGARLPFYRFRWRAGASWRESWAHPKDLVRID